MQNDIVMKVGVDRIFDAKKCKERKFSYFDIKYDPDKWADASKFLPADFDLVNLKILNRKKYVPAWSNGDKWDGANFRQGYKVLYWKRHE